MRCGLFGKLGAKRDFIALATPRSFLEAWEPWMQACLSASRHHLGEGWQQAFLTAPVWRFWLGAEICGTTVMGAVMPSLDGVGRYYPLALHAMADADAPPGTPGLAMTVPPISVLISTPGPAARGGLMASDTSGTLPPVWKNASRMKAAF